MYYVLTLEVLDTNTLQSQLKELIIQVPTRMHLILTKTHLMSKDKFQHLRNLNQKEQLIQR